MQTGYFLLSQLEQCAQLFRDAYNRPPWNNHWSVDDSIRYLQEIIDTPRFVGFTIFENNRLAGAALGYVRTWWTKDKLYVSELFIAPDFQRQGQGGVLLKCIEDYARELDLAGFTLLTDRKMPTADFYKKYGCQQRENIIFIYKKII